MRWALPAVIAAVVCALMVWQDGIQECNDGRRYTSKVPQPTPFHRRWCGWPRWLVIATSYLGIVFIATTLGSWWQSLMFVTLPGVWFCATRPTTVDGASMALAWGSSLLFPTHPWIAVLLACVSGFIHERGPVFAAFYAWHWLPLVGLVCVGWWRTPAPADKDPYVGLASLRATIFAHKPTQDWLSWKGWIYATRGVVPIAVLVGVPLTVWPAFAFASLSRLVGTDNSRYVLWGLPPIIAAMHDVPHWAIAVHALSFVRLF